MSGPIETERRVRTASTDFGTVAARTSERELPTPSDHDDNRRKRKYPSPISFRPTEAEREQLLRDANGMSQSAYIRQCLFGAKASKRVVPAVDRVLLAQILAKLGESRIANNLNQIAHHANTGSLVLDDVTLEEINAACLHVTWMRTQLIEALGLKKGEGKTNPENKSGAQ